MDELDKQLSGFLSEDQVREVKQLFRNDGWVKLPGDAQNVTITTSDNTHDGVLMTEQEWREKFNA